MPNASLPALGEETVLPGEAALTTEFIAFLKAASAKRYPTGVRQRFNQSRATGCVNAEFTVADGLPDEQRVGLFATPRTYSAWIRFANASSTTDRDKDIRGMAIRLSGVEGDNLTPGETTQDFVLNSHPVMVAANAADFLELLKANEAGGFQRVMYFLTHLKAATIGLQARKNPSCHLDIPYWSATPYRLGATRAVKYIVVPTSSHKSTLPLVLTDAYLRDAMRAHLNEADATFDFMVQFQSDPQRAPIEDATVEWTEADCPYHRVARIRIPRQGFEEGERMNRCEHAGFNPWHSLPDHRPLGSMNRARGEIYAAMAQFRAAGQ